MLSSFVLLVLVGSALSQPYASGNSYQQPGYQAPNYGGGNYGNSYLLNEIRALGGNVTDLSSNADSIDSQLVTLRNSNNQNSRYIDSLNEQVEEWVETITRQNEEIAVLELQAVKLLQLWDDVTVLNRTVKKLLSLRADTETELENLSNFAAKLQAQDASQDTQLAYVQKELQEQLKKVEYLEFDATVAEEQLAKLRTVVEEISEVQASELAVDESFILTSEAPEQTRAITADFGGRLPNLQWGVFRLVVANNYKSYVFNYANNGYGSSYASNPYTTYGQSGSYGSSGSYSQGSTYGNTYSKEYTAPLNFPATVAYDVQATYNQGTRDVTVALTDFSTGGWKVVEIGVVVTAAFKDNSILINYGASYAANYGSSYAANYGAPKY